MTAHLFGGRSLPGTPSDFLAHLQHLVATERLRDPDAVAAVARMAAHVDDVQRGFRAIRESPVGTIVRTLQDTSPRPFYTGHEGVLVWYAVESRSVYGGMQHEDSATEPRPVRAADVEYTLRTVYGTQLRRGFHTAWISQMARAAAACVVELPLAACTSFRPPPSVLTLHERMRRRGVYFARRRLAGDEDIHHYLGRMSQYFADDQRRLMDAAIAAIESNTDTNADPNPLRWPPPVRRGRRSKQLDWEAADNRVIVFMAARRLVEQDLPLCVVPVLTITQSRRRSTLAPPRKRPRRQEDVNDDDGGDDDDDDDDEKTAAKRIGVPLRRATLRPWLRNIDHHRGQLVREQPPLTPLLLHTFYRTDAPANEYLMLAMRAMASMLGVDGCYLPDPSVPNISQLEAWHISRHYRLLDSLLHRYGSRQRLWDAVCVSLRTLRLDGAGRARLPDDNDVEQPRTILQALRAFLVYVTPASHTPRLVSLPSSAAPSPALVFGEGLQPPPQPPQVFVDGRVRAALRSATGSAPGRMRHVVNSEALRVLRYLFARIGSAIDPPEELQRRRDESWPARPAEDMWRRYPSVGLFTLVATMRWEHETRQQQPRPVPAPNDTHRQRRRPRRSVAETGLPVQETVDIFLRDGRAADTLVAPANEEAQRAGRYPWLERCAALRNHSSFAQLQERAASAAPFVLELYEIVADNAHVVDPELALALLNGISVRGVRRRDRLGALPTGIDAPLAARIPPFTGAATPLSRFIRAQHIVQTALHPLPPERPIDRPAADALGAMFGYLEIHVPLAVAARRMPTVAPPPSHYASAALHAWPEYISSMYTEIAAAVPADHVFLVWPKQ